MINILSQYSREQVKSIAELRRLQDMFEGDTAFRHTALTCPEKLAGAYAGLGISADPAMLTAVLDNARKITNAGFKKTQVEWTPLEALYLDFKKRYRDYLKNYSENECRIADSRLANWRRRQIKRARSETGLPSTIRFFPAVTYELSKGCSMNCWFCGFSAGKFQGHFPHDKPNADLWRAILESGLDLIGEIAKETICYHTTEPFDNPDYLEFIQDMIAINGTMPQTTTAAPLRDIQKTKKLLAMRRENPGMHDRFSMIKDGDIQKVFKAFTPLELLNVELIHHNPGGLAAKSYAGRAFQMRNKPVDINKIPREYYKVESTFEQTTVECLTGFLVNMKERAIRLIIPCIANEKRPEGYRVLRQGTFENIDDYRSFIETAIEEEMPRELLWDERAVFRGDLTYEKQDNGFTLTSCSTAHKLMGKRWHPDLGDLINRGTMTKGEIVTELGSHGVPVVNVMSAIDGLFDNGLLAEYMDLPADDFTGP